jgi:hypothetical protein
MMLGLVSTPPLIGMGAVDITQSILDAALGVTVNPSGYIPQSDAPSQQPGNATLTPNNIAVCSNTAYYALVGDCWDYSFSAWQQAAELGANVTAIMVPPTPVAPPSQAQLDTCSDPSLTADQASACASSLAQSLANAALAQTQANINAAAQGAPPVGSDTPFCGTGSNQWISGIDNCVLLGLVAIGVLVVVAKVG